MAEETKHELVTRRLLAHTQRTDIPPESVMEISIALTTLLADIVALYIKTKNFHWHMNGSHFRDYHLLLDEQGNQLFAMTDDIAERVRKIGGTTLRSVSVRLPESPTLPTMTPIMSRQRTCSASYGKTTKLWCTTRKVCMSCATWPLPAFSRIGLTKLKDERGSSTKYAGTEFHNC